MSNGNGYTPIGEAPIRSTPAVIEDATAAAVTAEVVVSETAPVTGLDNLKKIYDGNGIKYEVHPISDAQKSAIEKAMEYAGTAGGIKANTRVLTVVNEDPEVQSPLYCFDDTDEMYYAYYGPW